VEDERPPVEAVSRRLVAPAGLWDDPREEAGLLQGCDRPSDPRFCEAEIAVTGERSPINREGQPQAPRRAPEPCDEHSQGEGALAVLGRRQGGLEPVEDRTRQGVAAGRRRRSEEWLSAEAPAKTRHDGRQDGREDELMLNGRHGFPFGLKARLRERCDTPAKLRRREKRWFPA